nr:FxDxF family PEP-CTERM protein [uncultured Sphingomonas sp.]
MKSLKLGVALAIAAAALPGTASAAEIITSGPEATTVANTKLEVGPDSSFTIGFSDAALSNPFNELLTFTTDVAGMLSIILSSTSTSALDDTDFSGVFLTGTGITSPLSISEVLADPNETRALNNFQVAAGTYTLNIQGRPGTQNGAFGGNVAFQSMAAVPEPGTWAMMLLGFGAVGFSMRRRRRGTHLYQAA